MKDTLRNTLQEIGDSIHEEDQKMYLIRVSTYLTTGMVALIMTLLNIATDKGLLTFATGAFAALSVIDVALEHCGTVGGKIGAGIFLTQILAMFTFFVISGNPDGFSCIWICMLPMMGMLFYGKTKGSIACAIMFVILVFFLWVPYGRSLLQYDYTETFCMRFPVLYVAFFFVSFLIQSIIDSSYKNMEQMREKYRILSMNDRLTGIANRQGMYEELEEEILPTEMIGVAMIDIDHFKKINDTYGHDAGDVVLQRFAGFLADNCGSILCRWGGEEFVIVYRTDSVTHEKIAQLKDEVANIKIEIPETTLSITVSIGIYEGQLLNHKDIDGYINRADEAMYQAKESGRNRIVYYNEMKTV